MSRAMLTLWDLLRPFKRPRKRIPPPTPPTSPTAPTLNLIHPPTPSRAKESERSRRPAGVPMSERYDELVQSMLSRHGVRVRKWRTSMTGVAWRVTYADARVARLIEAPRPRGPMSAAIFLHEIGHHAIGFNRYRPRCLEEYHAWTWAIAAMEREGIAVTDAVRRRMHESLHYSIEKAARRGLRALPAELEAFRDRLPAHPTKGRRGRNPARA